MSHFPHLVDGTAISSINWNIPFRRGLIKKQEINKTHESQEAPETYNMHKIPPKVIHVVPTADCGTLPAGLAFHLCWGRFLGDTVAARQSCSPKKPKNSQVH